MRGSGGTGGCTSWPRTSHGCWVNWSHSLRHTPRCGVRQSALFNTWRRSDVLPAGHVPACLCGARLRDQRFMRSHDRAININSIAALLRDRCMLGNTGIGSLDNSYLCSTTVYSFEWPAHSVYSGWMSNWKRREFFTLSHFNILRHFSDISMPSVCRRSARGVWLNIWRFDALHILIFATGECFTFPDDGN
jgi:hypothetical protein